MFRLKNIFILIIFIILSTLFSQPSNFFSEKVNVGDVSDKDIFAQKNHKFIDESATQKLIKDKTNAIQDVYVSNEIILETISSDFDTFIQSIIDTKSLLALKKKESEEYDEGETTNTFNFEEFKMNKISDVTNPFEFTNSELTLFLSLSKEELQKLSDIFTKELENVYESRVTGDNLEEVKRKFKNNSNFYYFFSKDIANLVLSKVSNSFEPNFIFDEEATNQRKEKASNNVDDIYKVIQKGERIVSSGEVVTEEQVEKLIELGLIKTNFNYTDVLLQLPYIALIFTLFYLYSFHFYKKEFSSISKYLFILCSIALVILTTNLIKDTFYSFIPFLTVLMIFMVFWGRKFVIFSSIILGLLLNISDFNYLSLSVIAGIVLILTFSRSGKRINLLISGILLGLALALSDAIVVYSIEGHFDAKSHLSFIFTSFSASVLTVGLIPLLENLLGMVTSVRLYELSDPNHPLLKRLMREALGTYTHSLMVGNLSEMAAEEIGANGLLLRVGSYFHDVGKLKQPEYFIENSTPSKNPHNDLEPIESANIIREHPIDSVKMCKEFKLPEPIINLIASHHGDAVLYHLYQPAKDKDANVDLNDFKYQTPTPKTKEEGILLLADSTEAYSRVLIGEPKEIVEEKLKEMIFSKVKHGILRDCALSMKDLDVIIKTFTNYLVNSNHERISYKKDNNRN